MLTHLVLAGGEWGVTVLGHKPRTQRTLHCKVLYLVFKGKGTYTLFLEAIYVQNQGIKGTKETVNSYTDV